MELNTRITTVVVYPDRARLTRQGRIELPAVRSTLEIADLSLQLLPDSVRVAARGSAPSRLYGLHMQQTIHAETPEENVRILEGQVEGAQDALADLDIQMKAIAQQKEQLAGLAAHPRVFARALAAGNLSMDQQLALYDRLRQRSAELDAESAGLDRGKRTAQRRLDQLQKQLDQVRSLRPTERYTAQVEVELSQPGELSLELSYVVSGAGWIPVYDVRLAEDGVRPVVELVYLAEVLQHSGEDWSDVSLTLSTARPAMAASAPKLDPWYVRPQPEHHEAGFAVRQMDMAMAKAAPAPMDAPMGMSLPAEEAYSSVEQTGAAVTYTVPGTVSIPPDGAAHQAVIARYPLPPKLDYVTVPSITPAVYRRAKVVNDSVYTLLPGKANLFAGDEYIGSTRLELTAPGGELELYLGVDDRVKVERKLLRREVDKTMIGGRRRLHYGYEIGIENRLPAPIEVLVRERYPVSRHEEIKVRLEGTEPSPSRQTELNQLEWQLTLPSSQKRSLRFDFQIDYPQTMRLAELDELG